MTRETRKRAIEKNRRALLRMVIAWLFVAKLFALKPNRTLPKRVGLWVVDLLLTAEKANYLLRLLTGHLSCSETMPLFDDAPLTIGSVIARLKALKMSLVQMRGWGAQQSRGRYLSDIRICVPELKSLSHFAKPCRPGFVFSVVFANCRAPPLPLKFRAFQSAS